MSTSIRGKYTDGGHGLNVAELPLFRKAVDRPPATHGTLAPELRAYYIERRRALLTELAALNKLLGLKSE